MGLLTSSKHVRERAAVALLVGASLPAWPAAVRGADGPAGQQNSPGTSGYSGTSTGPESRSATEDIQRLIRDLDNDGESAIRDRAEAALLRLSRRAVTPLLNAIDSERDPSPEVVSRATHILSVVLSGAGPVQPPRQPASLADWIHLLETEGGLACDTTALDRRLLAETVASTPHDKKAPSVASAPALEHLARLLTERSLELRGDIFSEQLIFSTIRDDRLAWTYAARGNVFAQGRCVGRSDGSTAVNVIVLPAPGTALISGGRIDAAYRDVTGGVGQVSATLNAEVPRQPGVPRKLEGDLRIAGWAFSGDARLMGEIGATSVLLQLKVPFVSMPFSEIVPVDGRHHQLRFGGGSIRVNTQIRPEETEVVIAVRGMYREQLRSLKLLDEAGAELHGYRDLTFGFDDGQGAAATDGWIEVTYRGPVLKSIEFGYFADAGEREISLTVPVKNSGSK